jgi:hypothetical protein
VALLTAAGASQAAARGWVAAVCTRRRAVAVSVARNLGDGPDGPFESGELRWLVAGDGTGWRVDPGELPMAVVRPAGADQLARGLDLLLGRSGQWEAVPVAGHAHPAVPSACVCDRSSTSTRPEAAG